MTQVVPAAMAAPTCRAGASFLDVITKQEVAAQWGTAATNARTALQTPDLCPQDRAVLTQKAVNDGLEALFADSFAPNDTVAAQRGVDNYRDLRAFAGQSGATLPSSRQIAGRAYDSGKFRLAQQSWEDALTAGEVATTDREQVRFYDATLFNLGKWYTDDRGNRARFDEGVRYLVTAHRIDLQFGLGSGAAGGRLRELFGQDEQTWPGDGIRSPLVVASR